MLQVPPSLAKMLLLAHDWQCDDIIEQYVALATWKYAQKFFYNLYFTLMENN